MLIVAVKMLATGGMEVKIVDCDSPDHFYEAVDLLKAGIPPGLRRYVPARKLWIVDAPAKESLRAWLMAVQADFGAEIEVEREAKAEGAPASLEEAYRALHLRPSAPPQVVRAAFKALASIHHPDVAGGDTRRMQEINLAYERLERGA